MYTAQHMALIIPPNIPGIPCKLFTPHVSQSPNFSFRQGDRYSNPRVDIMPPINPMSSAAPGLYRIPAGAPIITPPEMVAFSKCSISNFLAKKALVMKVARQLPVSDRIVFVMICVFMKGVVAKTPKLKEGQNIQRKRVPRKAKTTELQLVTGSFQGRTMEVMSMLIVSPPTAPKV